MCGERQQVYNYFIIRSLARGYIWRLQSLAQTHGNNIKRYIYAIIIIIIITEEEEEEAVFRLLFYINNRLMQMKNAVWGIFICKFKFCRQKSFGRNAFECALNDKIIFACAFILKAFRPKSPVLGGTCDGWPVKIFFLPLDILIKIINIYFFYLKIVYIQCAVQSICDVASRRTRKKKTLQKSMLC